VCFKTPSSQVRVEQFGAFVNIGAAKDGLVHISQLSVSQNEDL